MLQDDPIIKDFLSQRHLKPNTVQSYLITINQFSSFIGKSPTQLVEEAEDEEDHGIRMRRRKIKTYLQSFRDNLVERNFSPSHIKNSITIVKIFYHTFDIQTPRQKFTTKSERREEIRDIPTRKDIKTAFNFANPKYQAIILLMMSSGMGSGEVRHLKLTDLLISLNLHPKDYKTTTFNIGELIKTDTIPTWQIQRQKTGMPYFTFSSPESVEHIKRFLELEPASSLDDYIFPAAQVGGLMSGNSFSKYFKKLNHKCKFKNHQRQVFFKSHSLRKFFATTLLKHDFPQIKADWLLGHSIDKTTEAYFKPSPQSLKSDYLKVLPHLIITEKLEVKSITDERLQEQDEKIRKLTETIKAMEAYQKVQKG